MLRLLLPLDSQVRPSSQRSARAVGRPRRGRSEGLTKPSNLLTSYATPERSASPNFLEGQVAFSHPRLSNNRSVMPLDVRGCTRATLTGSACAYPTPAGAGNPLNPIRDGDRGLQLFPMNEEFPVSAGHKLALIKSLPFVHTSICQSCPCPGRVRFPVLSQIKPQAPLLVVPFRQFL